MLFAQRLFAPHAPRHAANAPTLHPRAHAVGTGRPALRLVIDRQADGACRLMISGRMADVCAELNRLAEH